MICGAELGEREKYCGNCGAKAPDGAVDKKEVEFETITPNEQNPPEWGFSWDAHNFFHGGKGRCTVHEMLWFPYFSAGIVLLISNIGEVRKASCFIDYLTVIIFFILSISIICVGLYGLKAGYYLEIFQKEGVKKLCKACILRCITSFLFAIIYNIFHGFVTVIYMLAVSECIVWISVLLISKKYYERRIKALIN